ncbi:MAG TPA: hypothetical protein VK856_08300 [Anaerolineaceae bacterium]|nr:hypothetical protein [Anaerolineaceae bacterium]
MVTETGMRTEVGKIGILIDEAVISLAIAAVPEGLPDVTTMTSYKSVHFWYEPF